MARLSTLLLAALLDSPALYHAFVAHDMSYTEALTRYLIAALVATLMLWMLRGLTDGYRRMNEVQLRAAARRAAQEAADEAAYEAAQEATHEAAQERTNATPARRSTDREPVGVTRLDLETVNEAAE
ncbi:hypothetical protein HC031_18880 [Planosporangium thailandense]|uniref:Uncharacterized protein n=1 Tax=Planosporangium thailandense TaxID=765197 RepID=A0ABX0Y2W1_9ACTN|nr:hypothetical protein [Planosporangium thailandense]NJC71769.1 hypothetical protein [Planosporangium thailandense]